jgi:hypothetical protein
MSNNDKLLMICIIGMWIGFTMVIIDVRRTAYQKGLREGWHRGRSVSRQEFWEE